MSYAFSKQQYEDMQLEQERLKAEGCIVYLRLGPFGYELDVHRPKEKAS